jgi:hypothetical protein
MPAEDRLWHLIQYRLKPGIRRMQSGLIAPCAEDLTAHPRLVFLLAVDPDLVALAASQSGVEAEAH